jgi:hypothetical protein
VNSCDAASGGGRRLWARCHSRKRRETKHSSDLNAADTARLVLRQPQLTQDGNASRAVARGKVSVVMQYKPGSSPSTRLTEGVRVPVCFAARAFNGSQPRSPLPPAQPHREPSRPGALNGSPGVLYRLRRSSPGRFPTIGDVAASSGPGPEGMRPGARLGVGVCSVANIERLRSAVL